MRRARLVSALMVIASVVVVLVGCSLLETGEECNYVSGSGMIKYLSLEGGFYGIIADGGEHYDPMNLPQEFQVDSLRVYFEGKVLCDVATIHMWGKPIHLFRIHPLDAKGLKVDDHVGTRSVDFPCEEIV